LSSTLLISIATFATGEAVATNQWDITAWVGAPLLAAILTAWASKKTWSRIVSAEPETNINFKRRHRHLLVTGTVIVIIFFAVAATVGFVIGRERAILVAYNADLDHEVALARRIGKARSESEANIASYVQMYKAIEPDTRKYESTLLRLESETSEYDAEFPELHQQTSKNIVIFENELRRSRLLEQEIAVAKQIEMLDQTEQLTAWRNQMQPLLSEEDALESPK